METYSFNTTVLKNGMIRIPESEKLIEKQVEVTLIVHSEEASKSLLISDFISKWAGAFSTSDLKDVKYQYLMEKYK